MIEGGGGGYLKNMGAISSGLSNLNYDWSLSIKLLLTARFN